MIYRKYNCILYILLCDGTTQAVILYLRHSVPIEHVDTALTGLGISDKSVCFIIHNRIIKKSYVTHFSES